MQKDTPNIDRNPTICTIVAPNYLAHARCLTESFLSHYPEGRVFVLLVDGAQKEPVLHGERFTVVPVERLKIADFDQMAFRYDVTELCTAVKPFFLEYLFEHYQLQRLIYFDPDIYFYQPINSIWSALRDASVVLTPHLVEPADDAEFGAERRVLSAGVYNLGFIGLARGSQLDPLLEWWKQRLKTYCLKDMQRGLFVDQRWADLIPGFFNRVRILREPVYNVAYWNIGQRRLERRNGNWFANGQPLVFYHFSGIPVRDRGALSSHFQTAMPKGVAALQPLLDDYRARLIANGFEAVEHEAYSFGFFDNKVPIPQAARHLWRNSEGAKYWPKPFQTADRNSFFNWLNREESAPSSDLPITNFALEFYRRHPDVQRLWPDLLGRDRESFLVWFVTEGAIQHGLHSAFTNPIRANMPKLTEDGMKSPPQINSPSRYAEVRNNTTLSIASNIMQRSGITRLIRRALGRRLMYLLYDRKMISSRQSFTHSNLD